MFHHKNLYLTAGFEQRHGRIARYMCTGRLIVKAAIFSFKGNLIVNLFIQLIVNFVCFVFIVRFIYHENYS